MPFPNPDTQFKPGQSGNPAGNASDRHSTKTIASWINELLNDETFVDNVLEGTELQQYKGAPIKAIIGAQIKLALQSKDPNVMVKSADLLLKHGGSKKLEIEHSGTVEHGISDPELKQAYEQWLLTSNSESQTP